METKIKKNKILTDFGREDVGVVDLLLDPGHQEVDILWGRDARGRLELGVGLVLPKVFVLGTCGHLWAGLGGAKVRDGSVDQVDPVEEVNNCKREKKKNSIKKFFSQRKLESED